MIQSQLDLIHIASENAIKVLLHNSKGPVHNLPRTAGWGYPEPYTRDLLISILGIAVSGNLLLVESIKNVLKTLAKNQSKHGHIPSLVHDKEDRGASDTTPLFIMAIAIYRQLVDNENFLKDEVERAVSWMEHQSPSDRYLVAQQPTSDWRDELWVPGHGLFVNTLTYGYLKLLEKHEEANHLKLAMSNFTISGDIIHKHVHEGLVVKNKPYYALWAYKLYSSERFDLLGNSLAILTGIASPERGNAIILWIEEECKELRRNGHLSGILPPNFFPYIQPSDKDWHLRYSKFNKPGDYHNGGIWPFVCGFYIAALIAVKQYDLASEKLMGLTYTIQQANKANVDYGFNEWHKAQNNKPMGQDWQSWSAAMYIYAAHCVQTKSTPYFDKMREN